MKKQNKTKQHTLGQEIFPLAMARLAPKRGISVVRRQEDHQKALYHRRNFNTYKNIFRNLVGFHHRKQGLHVVLAQGMEVVQWAQGYRGTGFRRSPE